MKCEYVGPVVEYGHIEWAARCIDASCAHGVNDELFLAGVDEAATRAYVERSRRRVELVSRYTAPWQATA